MVAKAKAKEVLTESEILEEDLIESRIGVHDSNHFEVKLDYSIRSQGSSRYNIDYYFFVPASLGVNQHTYHDDQFFSDVQAYIRFKTPNRTLASLAGKDSPIHKIRDLSATLLRAPRDQQALRQLTNELRMFGCIMRADVRDRARNLRTNLAEINGSDSGNRVLLSDAASICHTLVAEMRSCMGVWRELRPGFVDGRLPIACNETFAYVDEYLSLVVEMKLASTIRRIDAITGALGEQLEMARNEARDLLLAERHYRAGAGYSTVTGAEADDHFVYRQGLLKKFVMSVLWLDISKEKEGRRVANVGAAIAAGFAMLFALLATIWAGDVYGINSWNFVMAGVVTYILKDRIKDWLKSFFGTRFARFLYDYSIRIRDPLSGKRIGRCRESFTFLDPEDAPKSVLKCRRKDAKASIESMAKPEIVLHYHKQVKLSGADIIERMHLEDYNVNDIVRFSLSQFLARADDPKSTIAYFVEETDSVERRDFRKVYHLNLIMVLHSMGAGDPVLRRVRVIFDKKAIRELQEVQ